MLNKRDFSDFHVGDTASLRRKVTEQDILDMAMVSEDYNPVHMDDSYALQAGFQGRIAHGLFCCAMTSSLLANELPGYGTIILSEEMKFLAPVYINDELEACITIESLKPEKKRILLSILCKNQNDKAVVTGSTWVTID